MYYVYILKSQKTEKLYIGTTSDLKRRFAEHNARRDISTKFGAPYDLVYYEAYRSQSDALRRERKLKHFKQGYTRLKERIQNSIKGQN